MLQFLAKARKERRCEEIAALNVLFLSPKLVHACISQSWDSGEERRQLTFAFSVLHWEFLPVVEGSKGCLQLYLKFSLKRKNLCWMLPHLAIFTARLFPALFSFLHAQVVQGDLEGLSGTKAFWNVEPLVISSNAKKRA